MAMMIETNRVKREFKNLVDNAREMKVYDRGHDTGKKPAIYLASDRDMEHLEYAKRAGLDASYKNAAEAMMLGAAAATSEKEYSRRNFLKLGALGAAIAATSRMAGAQQNDILVYDPNTDPANRGKQVYKYTRKVPRGQGANNLGDIYTIGVWSDKDNKFQLAGAHKQLSYQDAMYPINPASPIWVPSSNPIDGMDYLIFMNLDSQSTAIGGCSISIPKFMRWTRLPIETDVNEGTGAHEVPSWLATEIRQSLSAWDNNGIQFYKEVPKGSSNSRLIFDFGDVPTATSILSSIACSEPGRIGIGFNQGRDDLHQPWFPGRIKHELGHGLIQLSHAPSLVSNIDASNDLMTPAYDEGAPQNPSAFNLATAYKMYGGELPNGAELVYSPNGNTQTYERLYVL